MTRGVSRKGRPFTAYLHGLAERPFQRFMTKDFELAEVSGMVPRDDPK